MQAELKLPEKGHDTLPPVPFGASNLAELSEQFYQHRQARQQQVRDWLTSTPPEQFTLQEEERFLDLGLQTALGQYFAGQFVEEAGKLVYASLFAKAGYLN
jgi:hypothetical protein